MPSAILHAIPAAIVPPASDGRADPGDAAHEAARYAVLRRLGSAIRHQIAGALQPVSMMASMVERRVQKDTPDWEVLRRNCTEMSTMARSASSECVALVGWLAPTQEEPIAVGQGIDECLHLLATEFSMRGFSLRNDAGDQHALVVRSRLRSLLPAALLALTDASTHHAQVQLRCVEGPATVTIQISLLPAAGDEQAVAAKGYRAITSHDVHALAQAEGIEWQSSAEGAAFSLPIVESQPRNDPERRWG